MQVSWIRLNPNSLAWSDRRVSRERLFRFHYKIQVQFLSANRMQETQLALNNRALEFCVQQKFTRKSQVLEVYLYLERSRTFFFLKKVLHVSQFIFHET